MRWSAEAIAIHVIRTSGDVITDRPLSEAGGKGLFTKELDTALMMGTIDIAVHASKDLPTFLPDAIAIAGYLPREDVRDAWISPVAASPQDLPRGARVGTASLRRGAMLKRLRPDLEITLMRGNVETRLRKLAEGDCAGTLLALAGLKRLDLAEPRDQGPLRRRVPARGRAGGDRHHARTGDAAAAAMLAPVLCAATGAALAAERAFLAALDGSCRTPIGAHATLDERPTPPARPGAAPGRVGGLRGHAGGRVRGGRSPRPRGRRGDPRPPAAGLLRALMRLLLTRAAEDAARTRALLEARGHRVVLSPVLRYAGTGASLPGEPPDAVVATSARAFAHAAAPRLGCRVPSAVSSSGSARETRRAMPASAAQPSSPPPRRSWPPRCGQSRRSACFTSPEWTARPSSRRRSPPGRTGSTWSRPTRRRRPPPSRRRRSRRCATGEIDAVLHFSRRSAAIFRHWPKLRASTCAGLPISASPPMSPPSLPGLPDLRVAAEPDEVALLALAEAP